MSPKKLWRGRGGGPPPFFPLVYSSDSRTLKQPNGTPFPILGRTAWAIVKLSTADYQFFLDDTASKGFNAIEFAAIYCWDHSNNRPYAEAGAPLPFSKRLDGGDWTGSFSYTNINNEAPDLTQTVTDYWTHLDGLLSYAKSKGLLCFVFPRREFCILLTVQTMNYLASGRHRIAL